jgi:putative (di)nucleoside polyphosphate hydrolase
MDDRENTWQMPQGGIDCGENPRIAALRELHEETGITSASARIVSSIDPWLEYEFPTKTRATLTGPWLRFRGQTQKWFLLEFHGADGEVDLMGCHGSPEFSEWQWMPLNDLPHRVVEFKQAVYHEVARHFGPRINAMRGRG